MRFLLFRKVRDGFFGLLIPVGPGMVALCQTVAQGIAKRQETVAHALGMRQKTVFRAAPKIHTGEGLCFVFGFLCQIKQVVGRVLHVQCSMIVYR